MMKKSIFKKAIVSSLLLGLLTVSSSHAAAPVAQQAYYDTFSFKVNGVIQYISDITKKPFIANSRVYVPISTLSDLGIAKVEWIPSNGGINAELRVTPASSQVEDKSTYYEQKLNEMATESAQKDTKIKELEESVKKLTDENATLKKKGTTADSSDRDVRKKVSDLEYELNKDRYFNRINIGKGTFDVNLVFDYGRKSFDVKAYVKGLNTADLDYIKNENSRSVNREFERYVENIAYEITKQDGFKNVDVYIVLYDSSNKDREIANYDYKDGRLRGSITLR
ncbi:hypothetical protein HMPREF1142_1042 [Peptostreptococcaceae bacterium AS15]|nr:hypothetical protein HMPREF0379_1643 [[Eubacterium] yurii subsp. margaretiae ATCC 43715]EJP23094.1 hypothetical protein HMPREF1142_1042 [Peptostreptococcaceae bacterium AS15]